MKKEKIEKIKRNILKKFNDRIKFNSRELELEYITARGKKLLKKGTKLEDLPQSIIEDGKEVKLREKEKIILKRSIFLLGDWSRIYKPIEEVDGELKINWVNLLFGGKNNLIKLILLLLVIGFVLIQFSSNFHLIEQLKVYAQACNPGELLKLPIN